MPTFDVVFTGSINPTLSREEVIRRLTELYGRDSEQVERTFFTGGQVRVMKDAGHDEAVRFAQRLAEAGLLCQVVETRPPAPEPGTPFRPSDPGPVGPSGPTTPGVPGEPMTALPFFDPHHLNWLFFSFKGRVNRLRYWPARAILLTVAIILAMLLDAGFGEDMAVLAFLLTLYPELAVAAKRAHDRNRTAWFLLLSFVPLVSLWPFVELGFIKGTTGPNRFGPDPVVPVVEPRV